MIRTTQHLAALMPVGDALMLDLLRYPHELRDPGELDLPGDASRPSASPKEVAMAEQLVATIEEPWRPEAYHDTYRDEVLAMIQEKAEKGEITTVAAAQPAASDVIDIMAMLKRSIDARGTAAAGGSAADGVGPESSEAEAHASAASRNGERGQSDGGRRTKAA